MQSIIEQDLSLEQKIKDLEKQIASLNKKVDHQKQKDSVCLVCFSGDWDRLFAAMTIASGSLALGMEVHMFFSFWSVSALRKKDKYLRKNKSTIQQMFNHMLPGGLKKAPLSKFQMGGLGKFFLRKLMKQKGVDDLDVLFSDIEDLGAKIYVCDTSAQLFGIDCQELGPEDIKQCGSTTFLAQGLNSKMTLFI